MKLFDAQVYADARPDSDFANMAWFDVERVVICAHAPRPFETARDLWEYLDQLVGAEVDRLARIGLEASVALGIHPRAIPRRAHYEIWRELPQLLANPNVAALGEIGLDTGDAREWRLIDRQLGLLAEHGIQKPVIFRLALSADTRLRRSWISRLGALLDAHALDPQDVLVQHVDWMTIDQVLESKMKAGLTVSPYFSTVEEVRRIIVHHGTHEVIVSTGTRVGQADVLAMSRVGVALSDAGLGQHDIERAVYGNAMGLFVR